MLLLLVVALVLAPRRCDGCYIQGYDSGHCVDTAGPVVSEAIPFCAPYVNAYPSVCLPNEYDYFPNHTAKSKDAWVMQWVMENIARRQSIEEKNGNGFTLGACGARFLLRGGEWSEGLARSSLAFTFCWVCAHLSRPPLPHARTRTCTCALRPSSAVRAPPGADQHPLL